MAQVSTPSVRPRVARRSVLDVAVDRTWRFFCSVRAAIIEIAILALLVLIGTLRGSSVPRGIADALPATGPVVERWYAWDVFRSLPFMAMLALVSVAIAIGGIINRAPGIWAAIARPTVTTTHGFLRNAETSAEIVTPAAPAELAERLRGAMRAARYRVLMEERGGEIHLYADRFRFARLATFPFHLALILVLVGGIVGARWGFREQIFTIPEGSTREVGHGTGLSVRLDDFVDSYRENGVAQEYRSNLTLFKDGEPVTSGAITVNNPMTYGNVAFYQSSFGQAVALKVTDAEGRVLYDDALPLEYRSQANPNAPAGKLDLPVAGMTLTVIGPDDTVGNVPEQDAPRVQVGHLYAQVRPYGPDSPIGAPVAATIRQGTPATLAGVTIDFVREKRFTLLQVASNPGIPIFIAASLLMVGGLAVTFYFPHRRVRGIVAAAPGGGSRATLAPLARRDWSGKRAFERLLDAIEERVGAPATWRERPPNTGDGSAPTGVATGG